MITNGEFVDNMLDKIVVVCDNIGIDLQLFLNQMRDHYTKEELNYSPLIGNQIRKIDLRVAEMYHTIDPMWFVVALHHRNQGGFWRDMQRYGIRRNESSYKVEKASSTK
ncbi:hypothetical protein KAR91_79945 [Candidatus Pacearchaeota archaeon]|nr:hypothetical protein [Candidatus Pacearchaeota archaeon]